MFKQIAELARLLWSLGQETKENKQAIKELREELRARDERLRALAEVVQRLAFEIQRLKENETHEREKWHCVLKMHCSVSSVVCPQALKRTSRNSLLLAIGIRGATVQADD
jgi:hypothetical protein